MHISEGGDAPSIWGDLGIGLWRRFVPLGRVIDTEAAIERRA